MESVETLNISTASLIDKAFALGMIQQREEITALVDLLRTLRPKNVMEIGSESGGTFYLWCRLTALGGMKISLDLPTGASGSCKYADPETLAGRTQLFKSWSANIHVVTGDSHAPEIKEQVRGILGDEQLDFLFIDGDHSYEGVKRDYAMYREFVRPGGLIAFHDILDTEHHRLRSCYVAKFWAEIEGGKVEFTQGLEWGGIGCVRV